MSCVVLSVWSFANAAVEVPSIVDKSAADAWLARFGEIEEEATDEADTALGSEERPLKVSQDG